MIFPIIAGVRQGGLLSPVIFAIYIEDLVTRLKASKFGCCLNGVYYGCLVYADDVLLSHSVQVLQNMLYILSIQKSASLKRTYPRDSLPIK